MSILTCSRADISLSRSTLVPVEVVPPLWSMQLSMAAWSIPALAMALVAQEKSWGEGN